MDGLLLTFTPEQIKKYLLATAKPILANKYEAGAGVVQLKIF